MTARRTGGTGAIAFITLLAALPAPLLAQAAETTAPVPAQATENTAPAKPAKIKDKSHPDYVRCRSEEIIGSRAQFKRTCMTNREWSMVATRGDDRAKEMLNKAQRVGGFTPQ